MFRDETLRFVVSADGEAAAEDLRAEIETLRESGELARINVRMCLE